MKAIKRTSLLVLFAAAFAQFVVARSEESQRPKSGAVKRAILKRDRAVGQADAAYLKTTADANKALLAELKKAKDAAIAAKDLEEANAVVALIAATEQESARADGKRARRAALVTDPTKGIWIESGGSRGSYRKDGTVKFDVWAADGKWEAVGPHTVTQLESNGMKSTVTFSADGRHALWVFADGGVSWARRAE